MKTVVAEEVVVYQMSTEDSGVIRFLKIKLQICRQWCEFRDYPSESHPHLQWWDLLADVMKSKHKGLEMGRAQYQVEETPWHLVLGTPRDLSTRQPNHGLGVGHVCRSCCHQTALQTEQGYCLQVFRTQRGMGIWEMV